jgi:iron(III) transport system substrate-binding protein
MKQILALAFATLLAACGQSSDVTLYVALDQEHSEALVRRFEEESGLRVNARFDTEASKTVGLVSAIVSEKDRPRCDVFWNNELAHTVSLGQKGLLEPYASTAAAGIPAAFKAEDGTWTGFAARARILIVSTDKLGTDRSAWPTSIEAFADPKWKGRCAIARPLTGTTLTHFAALRFALGEERFGAWLDAIQDNVVWLQSNGATMRQTADPQSEIAFALTDTDDFHVALQKGHAVGAVFPDQAEGGLGTMLIPNSVAVVRGGPHPEAAKKLVDFIVSEQVEGILAASKSAQIPVRASVQGPSSEWILGIDAFRPMVWDAGEVASHLAELSAEFAQRYGGSR